MEYVLFVLYLLLFAWLVTKTRFFARSGLSKSQLIIIFLVKVMAGIFYGWMGAHSSSQDVIADTWLYHRAGIDEYHLIASKPAEYFTNIFNNPYAAGWGNLFGSSDSYWNDLKGNLFVKMLSVFDILSFGHYYVNVIFFSFISMFGPVALYRVMADLFPVRKLPVMLAVFFVPSFIYWASGIHKEGLIFLAMSLVLYHLYFGWKEKKYTIARWLGIIGGLVLLFILRNFLTLLILPAIVAWFLAIRWPKYGLAFFTSVYLLFGVLFFTARYIDPKFDFPQVVVDKQQSFLQLRGGVSAIPIRELQPTASSFLRNTPQAITLAFLRPYPGDVHDLLSLAASLEIALLLLLFLLFLFFRKKNTPVPKNPIYLCVFISFFILLAIGFSINNIGAIVRYRSIIIPFLMVPVVAQTDWEKLQALYTSKIKPRGPKLQA